MEQRIAISQPRYLPAANYIERLLLCDIFVLLDDVPHQRRSFEHRNRIKTKDGAHWLSIPIIREGRDTLIKDTRIDQTQHWQNDHLTTVKHAYARAPYFNEIAPFFEHIYTQTWTYLEDLCITMLHWLISYFSISCQIVRSSTLAIQARKDEQLLAICQKLGGTRYISGPNGRNYLRKQNFEASGVKISFHDYLHPVYKQLHGSFLPYMSVFDMLFTCGRTSINLIRSGVLHEI